jgi:uncharacterized phage protein (TIGR02218 family)
MTYSTIEQSAADARPVELYEFRRDSLVWRYTSADQDVTFATQLYLARTIERSAIEQGSEMNRANLQLTVQRDLDVVQLFQVGPPSDPITCTLKQYHYGDTDAATLWQGRIISCTPWEGGRARLVLEPIYTALRRNGIRRYYQRSCPHLLYGPDCTVNNTSYRVTGNVTQINGLVIQQAEVGAYAAGYFTGGYLEWDIDPPNQVYERRFIEAHSSVNLTVTSLPLGLTVGTQIRVYPGCDHLLTTCNSKFANAVNYGGLPFLPTVNPFGGTSLY